MNKIKVISLLVRIANGENIPKKIKYDNQVFEYRKDMLDYYCCDYDFYLMGYPKILNEEVEIIEEDKKIEKIDYIGYGEDGDLQYKIIDKINEIIDVINEGKDE